MSAVASASTTVAITKLDLVWVKNDCVKQGKLLHKYVGEDDEAAQPPLRVFVIIKLPSPDSHPPPSSTGFVAAAAAVAATTDIHNSKKETVLTDRTLFHLNNNVSMLNRVRNVEHSRTALHHTDRVHPSLYWKHLIPNIAQSPLLANGERKTRVPNQTTTIAVHIDNNKHTKARTVCIY